VSANEGVCLDLEQVGKGENGGGDSPEDGHDDGAEDTGDKLRVTNEVHDTLDGVAGGDNHDGVCVFPVE